MANPWENAPIVRKAGAGGGVMALGAPDPFKVAAEDRAQSADQRAQAALGMDATRLQLSQMQTQLAQQAAARAAENEAKKDKTLNARGGIDTTEGERKASGLATRLAGGIQDLARIGKTSSSAPSLVEGTLGGTKLGNYAISGDRQRVINAQLDMLDAALTLGTGAAYNKEQLEGYRASYFPQPGDEPETIADKRLRLQRVVEAGRLQAGAAGGMIDEALKNSGMFAETEQPTARTPAQGAPMSGDQQRLYDAYLASNPQATADQLRAFASAAGIGNVENAEAIVAARQAGSGVAPGATARYGDTIAGQGLSGVNEGVRDTLSGIDSLLNPSSWANTLNKGLDYLTGGNTPQINEADNPTNWRHLFDSAILPESANGSGQFSRRVGQSVGAAALPIAGTATTGARAIAGLLSAGAGGIGAAEANRIAPGNQYADMAGDVAGSLLAGGGAAAMAGRSNRKVAEALVPSIDQLKSDASGLYRAAESRGVVAGPNVTSNLAGKIEQIARDKGLISQTGRVSEAYPRAREAMAVLNDAANGSLDVKQMQVVREGLADAVQATRGTERHIARSMLSAFDEEMAPLAPELAEARRTASRYLSAEKVGKTIKKSETDASRFSQSGEANALKTRFRQLEQRVNDGKEQFSPAVANAISNVVQGTPATKAAEWAGKFSPRSRPGIAMSLMSGGGFAASGSPIAGALVSGGLSGVGEVGRRVADSMVARNASVAELLARNGGALEVAPVVDQDLRAQIAAMLAAKTTDLSR